MDPRIERKLHKISEECFHKLGMKDAIKHVRDEQQLKDQEYAKWVLAKTELSTGNSMTADENKQVADAMKKIINEEERKIAVTDPHKMIEYNKMVEAKVRKAVQDGEIPAPKADRFMKDMQRRMRR